jgi:chromate transporter
MSALKCWAAWVPLSLRYAVVIAPVAIMVVITRFFIRFHNNQYLEDAFLGLRYVTVGLIASVAVTIAQTSFLILAAYLSF